MVKTVKQLKKEVVCALQGAGIAAPFFEADILMEYAMGIDKVILTVSLGDDVGENQQKILNEALKMRIEHYPLQYIIGKWEFFSLPILLSKDVLIPRQDTECLVESAIEWLKGLKAPKVLDICCGTGCIGIAVAHNIASSKVVLCDISNEALKISRKNIELNGLKERVETKRADALLPPDNNDKFDAILCNPPYIKSGELGTLQAELGFEPVLALDGGEDGLMFYRAMSKNYKSAIRPGGFISFEVGIGQANDVVKILEDNGYTNIMVKKDYGKIDRVVTGETALK